MRKLNSAEKMVLEAVRTLLAQPAELGLSFHKDDEKKERNAAERGYEYLHNTIDNMFEVKAVELTHSESVCRAFRKIHGYKYIDDNSFSLAMEHEMVSQGVPVADREVALGILEHIIKELNEDGIFAEKDSGFNPELDDIMEMPEQSLEFTIIDSSLNKNNITSDNDGRHVD